MISHVRAEVREQAAQRFANVERLEAGDIADAITYVVTRTPANGDQRDIGATHFEQEP